MKINSGNYQSEHAAQRQRECASGFVDACANVGTFRGNLGALASAITNTGVSIDFQFVITTVRKFAEIEAEKLRERGVEVIFHDADGRDIEFVAVSFDVQA